MSHLRPDYNTRFSSKGAFDALKVEDLSSEEEEEEPVIVEADEPPAATRPESSSKPLTKTQLKKAAKAAKRAVTPTLPESDSTSARTFANDGAHDERGLSSSLVGPSEPLPASFPLRARSRSPPGSAHPPAEPQFTPTLPTNLPRPLPPTLVRKRKASQDLAPAATKESKVEVEHTKSDGQTVTTTIPVSVQVSSSSTEVARQAEVRALKIRNAGVRIGSGLALLVGFCGLLVLGHAYMIMLVLVIQTLVYREITTLFQGTNDPWSKTLNWYFFAVANYYLYGETIIYYFKHVVFSDALFLPFAANHRFISFMLYVIGFMGFVASLKRNYLQRQFSLFGWVHMTLLVIVVSSHFIVNNILEGMIWFWVPAFLVICNDVFAWVWGVTLGRTQLFALSPKKTVEGFVGAFFSTLILGFFWGTFFMRYNYMICPVHDLGSTAWNMAWCKPNPVFIWREFQLVPAASAIASFLVGRPVDTIPWAPFQFHVLVMACFASLAAPFGGFFASGFKRAFNVKDFGQSIPGHGGMTDRMDCQFLMGMFSYVYYSNLIRVHAVTVGSVLQTIASGLSVEEQWTLLENLRRLLEGQSALNLQNVAL